MKLVLLETGEELTLAAWGALAGRGGALRVKLVAPEPPFRPGDVVHLGPGGAPPRGEAVLLWSAGDGLQVGAWNGAPGEVLGQVLAVERGPATFSLERGLLSRVPARWLGRALDAFELAARLSHPLMPSLSVGPPEASLAGVRAKYNREVEARQYAGHVALGLDQTEQEIVTRHLPPGARILDVGCGAGREAVGLARLGYRVVGIDIAPRMIARARAEAERQGLGIEFRVQTVTDLEEPPGSFDAAYWVGSYHHIPGRALRVETLRRLRGALAPGGVLILMVFYRAPRGLLSRSRLVDALRRAGRRLLGPGRLSEPGDTYMRETSEASDPAETCFFHDFSGPWEVREEVEAAGFTAHEVAPGWWVCRPNSPA
jgi:SAM-dependent methyltransferase